MIILSNNNPQDTLSKDENVTVNNNYLNNIRAHLIISGKVQGVYFRKYTQEISIKNIGISQEEQDDLDREEEQKPVKSQTQDEYDEEEHPEDTPPKAGRRGGISIKNIEISEEEIPFMKKGISQDELDREEEEKK